MGDFMKKARDFVDKHEKQVDQAVEKVGEQVDRRTGNKHGSQIDKGVDMVQRRTGQGDTGR